MATALVVSLMILAAIALALCVLGLRVAYREVQQAVNEETDQGVVEFVRSRFEQISSAQLVRVGLLIFSALAFTGFLALAFSRG